MSTPRAGTGRSSEFIDGTSLLWTFAGTISTDQNGNIPRYTARARIPLTQFWVNFIVAPIGGNVSVGFYVEGVLVATVTVTAGQNEAFTNQNVTVEEGEEIYIQVDSMSTTTPPVTMTAQAV